MAFKPTSTTRGIRTSPLLIVGSVIILLIIVLALAIQNINREKRYMSQVLSEKGAALIKAFEAGTRTGMMSMMWGGNQVQRLLEETARQPDILYLIITDKAGKITAHSDRSRIGEDMTVSHLLQKLTPGEDEQWHLTDLSNNQQAFEVYRFFRPLANAGFRSQGYGMMGRSTNRDSVNNDSPSTQIIFVGLDVSPFEEARKEDIRNTIIISSVLVILGFGGFISLFWAQSYRSVKRSLQDASAFADELVTNLPVGLIATGRDGKIAFFNETAEKITGINLADVRGKDPDEVLPSGLCGLKDYLDEGKTVLEKEMECGFLDRDTVPLSLSATRIINEEGQLVGTALILRDLGEVRKLQEEVRRKEKLAALGGLAAGVAHELRNPLSSIKGLASYFYSKFSDGSDDREATEVMIREVDRLDRVISELLYYARPSELKIRPTNINDVLDQAVSLVQQDAKTKGLEIQWSSNNNLPKAPIDPDRFSQCILNLYLNAIQAMEKGGVLSVRGIQRDNKEIIIEVEDNGKGIAQDDLEKIFDPYFTTKPSGTGLGLAIVHKIIEAHHGRIKVVSAPGKGTIFTISIPLQ
ncbi:ATP-binding protein [Thermodesulfobacteriota bacterium]